MAILKKHAICYRSAKYIRNCQIVILPQQKSKSDTATRKKENRQTVTKKNRLGIIDVRLSFIEGAMVSLW
jgi:hypothetical protein